MAGLEQPPASQGISRNQVWRQSERAGLYRPFSTHRLPPNTYMQNAMAMLRSNRVSASPPGSPGGFLAPTRPQRRRPHSQWAPGPAPRERGWPATGGSSARRKCLPLVPVALLPRSYPEPRAPSVGKIAGPPGAATTLQRSRSLALATAPDPERETARPGAPGPRSPVGPRAPTSTRQPESLGGPRRDRDSSSAALPAHAGRRVRLRAQDRPVWRFQAADWCWPLRS
ncbi:hypothetical protein NDU88_002960 [Pleurodeles waltl]|uniref:Uncharacterized protein n=1 Tax=Pleurodeles waltl TaxID=8319 RepID=A0AAV7M3Z9_PLEWA|nr:hypothetical protein NDU88_002960 [Pleurodeles waltl]